MLEIPFNFASPFLDAGVIIANDLKDIMLDILSSFTNDIIDFNDIYNKIESLTTDFCDTSSIVESFSDIINYLIDEVAIKWVGKDADMTKMFIDTVTGENFLDEMILNIYNDITLEYKISTNPTGSYITPFPDADIRNNGIISIAPLNKHFPIVITFGMNPLGFGGVYGCIVMGNLRDYDQEKFLDLYIYGEFGSSHSWYPYIGAILDVFGFAWGMPFGERDHRDDFYEITLLDFARDVGWTKGTIDLSFSNVGLGFEYWVPIVYTTSD